MKDRALKTYIFYCTNNLSEERFSCLGKTGDTIKTVGLPCSGKIDIPYLVKAFENGADGVAIITCKKDDCRNFEGNLRATKRASAVESLLEEIGITSGRMTVIDCGQHGPEEMLQRIDQFMEQVRKLPSLKTTAKNQESTVA